LNLIAFILMISIFKAEDWGTEQQEHKWKISDIATFASNMGIILYSCSEGAEQKVMLTHNEHIIDEQPACGETLCSVEDFKAYYQHIVDFDWDSECPMPEVLLLLFIVIVYCYYY